MTSDVVKLRHLVSQRSVSVTEPALLGEAQGEKIMSTNTADAANTTVSGHCGCDSHGGNAVEENRDPQQHSMRDGCCSGSAEFVNQAHGNVHQAHRHAHSKGDCCSSKSHAEAGSDSPTPSTRTGGEKP